MQSDQAAQNRERALLFGLCGLASIAVVFVIRGARNLWGLFGPLEYFATHWARDYSDGFKRRGFLGEALKWIGLDNSSYLLMSAAAWIVSLLLALALVEAVWRLTRSLSLKDGLAYLVLAIISPATTGVIAETTGDPLQIVVLLFLLLNRFLLRPLLAAPALCAFTGAAVLVHEGSLFFIIPTLAFEAFVLRRTVASRAALAGSLAGAAAAMIALLWFTVPETGVNPPIRYGGEISVFGGHGSFRGLGGLLKETLVANFASGIRGYASLLARIVGVLLIPSLLMAGLVRLCYGRPTAPNAAARAASICFLVALIGLLPLLLTTDDWGRFVGYSFILTIVSLSHWLAPMRTDEVSSDTRAIYFGAGMLLSGLTTSRLLDGYLMDGLKWSLRVSVVTALVLGVALVLGWRLRVAKDS